MPHANPQYLVETTCLEQHLDDASLSRGDINASPPALPYRVRPFPCPPPPPPRRDTPVGAAGTARTTGLRARRPRHRGLAGC
jgi:hypothetical protein